MVAGYTSGIGISVIFKSPIALGSSATMDRLPIDAITSYGHKISAIGGYESADIGLIVPSIAAAEMWFVSALGWHVEVYGRSGLKIWEGFIDKINVNGAQFTATYGPLMDAVNRDSVMYTPIIGIDPDGKPITGTETETTIAENATSQAKFGILERVLSGGQMWDIAGDNDAEYARDKYLEENAYPKSSTLVTIGSSGASGGITIMLSCRGYMDWFEKYVYNYGGYQESDTVTSTMKLLDVLNAEPNGIVSTNQALISDNLAILNGNEVHNRTALTIIKEILTLGDGAGTPYTFGLYNGRVARYAPIPSTVEYYYKIFTEKDAFTSANNETIDPYDILPGKWALVADFQVDSIRQGYSIVEDPRGIFIESVEFTAPNSLSISSSPVLRLPQLLANLGYGGLS